MIKYPDLIDLHMHTTFSDGTDTPQEIFSRVKASGIKLFSVTDHDDVKSGKIIRTLRKDGDPLFITGVEFSCRDEHGKYHILGYGCDPDAEPVRRITELAHSYRTDKVRARLDFLKSEFGFEFPPEEIDALFALDNPGKPHIGNLMVKYGYAQTKDQAIEQYINKHHSDIRFLRPGEAIESILCGGGIPVLAHPFYGSGDQLIVGDEMDERLARLTGFGLKGVEAFYSGFNDALLRDMIDFADRYGLYITAGSDYHGSNKTVLLGDTGLDRAAEWPDALTNFIEAVGAYAEK